MTPFTFDPCLMYTNEPGLCVIGLKTYEIRFAAEPSWEKLEQEQLEKAKFTDKAREKLTPSTLLKFNRGTLHFDEEKQCEYLRTIKSQFEDMPGARGKFRKASTPKDQYIAQRARGAYIATVYQTEASYDLSSAAQVVNPTEDDYKALGKRLESQIKNPTRGLKFIPLDFESIKIIVFTDLLLAIRVTHPKLGMLLL